MGHHGFPCWYELSSRDPGAAAQFYAPLMGWDWADAGMEGMEYQLASTDAGMVAGLAGLQSPEQPTAWTCYFAVTNCDATAEQAAALGAAVVVPPSDITGTGRFALLVDPQGAGFGILEPLPGGQGGAFDQSRRGHGNWHDLETPDVPASIAFYGTLFGWVVSRSMPMGPDATYNIIANQGQDMGGVSGPMPGQARWTPYFGVDSVDTVKAGIESRGGKSLHGPAEVPGGAFILHATDPQGAIFAVVGPR